MADFIKAIGRSFIVSSFMPAALFVIIGAVLLQPALELILPDFLAQLIILQQFPPSTEVGVFFFLLSSFIGFTLFSLNEVVYKLFEGYYLSIPPRLEYHRKRRLRLYAQLKLLKKEKARLEEPLLEGQPVKDQDRLNRVRTKILQLHARLSESYPPPPRQVLPTSFGNVLGAYEAYPGDRYGINCVISWPRLLHVIPDFYRNLVEENNNFITFLLNSSLLLGLLSISSFFIAGYMALPGVPISERHVAFYLAAGTICLISAYGLYKGSAPLARVQGDLVRSCYDLFRFDLLKQLHLPLPNDDREEKGTWRMLETFMIAGRDAISNVIIEKRIPLFRYEHKGEKAEDQSQVQISFPEEVKVNVAFRQGQPNRMARSYQTLVPTLLLLFGFCYLLAKLWSRGKRFAPS